MKNHSNNTIIQIFGLPGSGKTTLSSQLQRKLGCMWFNADKVRSTISLDLGFTDTDRLKQASRLGQLCALVLEYEPSGLVIADFVNPTNATRFEFNNSITYPSHLVSTRDGQSVDLQRLPAKPLVYSIFMNTISPGSSFYPDTVSRFQPPEVGFVNLELTAFPLTGRLEAGLLNFISSMVESRHETNDLPRFTEDTYGRVFDGKSIETAIKALDM